MKIIQFTLLALGTAFTGCAEHDVDFGQAELKLHFASDGGPSMTVSGCQASDSWDLDRECALNAQGPVPDSHGEDLPVVSVAPPYGVYMDFARGFDPSSADATTEGADAAVKVYAAPVSVHGFPCCPEDEESNRVSARALFPDEGGMLVVVEDPVPSGTQLAFRFNYAKLHRSYLQDGDPAKCSSSNECDFVKLEYMARFYVGSAPDPVGTAPAVTGQSSQGGPTAEATSGP